MVHLKTILGVSRDFGSFSVCHIWNGSCTTIILLYAYLTSVKLTQGCPLSPPLVNTLLKVLARVVSQRKEIKWIQAGKKDSKLFLFADDKILYLTNQKEYLDLEKGVCAVMWRLGTKPGPSAGDFTVEPYLQTSHP